MRGSMRTALTVISVAIALIAIVEGCGDNQSSPHKNPRELVDSHMAQWKRHNPDRAERWVEEEKATDAIEPPADNSYLLKGKQGEDHSYGNYTKKDILMWSRKTEKLAARVA